MSSVQSLQSTLMKQYLNRPRETFTQKLRRLDYAGRLEALAEARKPRIPPTRQPSFPDMIEAKKAIERRRRQERLRDDFAARIEAIRERLERFAPRTSDTLEEPRNINRRAPDLGRLRLDPPERVTTRQRCRVLLLEALAMLDRAIRTTATPRRRERVEVSDVQGVFANYADPVVQKSGIQFFTGTQLDVAV